MRDRRLILLLTLLLLPAGAALSIHSPDGTYTEDGAVTVNVSTKDGYTVTRYEIAGTDISGHSLPSSLSVPDGEHTFRVWASNGNKTRNASSTFTVDTHAPTFLAATPRGQYLSNRTPEISYTAEDLTGITGAEFLLNGTSILSNPVDNSTDSYTPDEPLAEGLHTVTVNLTDAYHPWHAMTWTFTLPKQPVVSNTGPADVDEDGNVTISVTARDPSGIDEGESTLDVEGPGINTDIDLDEDDVEQDGHTYSYDLHHLKSGTYTVDYSIVDGSDEGHTAKGSWEFTVDTVPPNVSITSPLDGDIVTGKTEITVDASDLHSSVAEVLFKFAGSSKTDKDAPFSATIDSAGLDTGSAQIMIEATDVADNEVTDAVTVTADNRHPQFESLDIYPRTVSSTAYLSAVVEDAASAIRDVTVSIAGKEYSATPQDGTYNTTRETVAAILDLAGVENGNHSVTVTVEDGAGHVTRKTRTIIVNHGLSAGIAVDVDDRHNITVGEEMTVTATVRNTGDVGERVDLGVRSDLPVSVPQAVKRVGAGETRQFRLHINAPESASYGPRQVNLSIDGLVTDRERVVTVVVLPPPAVRNRIESRFADLQSNLSALRERRDQYGSGFGNTTLARQINATRDTVTAIRAALQEGRYGKAQTLLDSASAEMEQTKNVFTGAVAQHRQETFRSMVVTALLGLLVLGLVYGGYRVVPVGEGYDPDDGFLHRPDGKHPFRARAETTVQEWRERIEALRERDDEETGPTYNVDGWSGYGDDS